MASNIHAGTANKRVHSHAPVSVQMSESLLGSQGDSASSKDPESLCDRETLSLHDEDPRRIERKPGQRRRCWTVREMCQWLNNVLLYDPSTQGVKVKGLNENPFYEELAHGESFRYGLNNQHDDPTIRVHLSRVVNPVFRGLCAIVSLCLSEIYFRFMYVIFTSETRLAMTDQGRILIWSHDVRGQRTTFRQILLKVFATKASIVLILIVFCVTLFGEVVNQIVQQDVRQYNLLLGGACLAYIMFQVAHAIFLYAKKRVKVSSQAQMRSFLASDLCATTFMLQHQHSWFGRHTTSEVRLFFGRYPQVEDMWGTGKHVQVADVGLVETNPETPEAGGEGESSITATKDTKSQPWWLAMLAVASTVVYCFSATKWIYIVYTWVIGGSNGPEAPETIGFLADFVVFLMATKAWIDMRSGALLNQKPVIRVTDKFQSNITTTSTDTNFSTYVGEIEGFLSAMVGLAVECGRGLRSVPPQAFSRHGRSRADFGSHSRNERASVLSGRLWTDIDSLDSTMREALISSEILYGDGFKEALDKYSQFVSLIDGEFVLAVYPVAKQSRLRRRILSTLTCSIYYYVWKYFLPHVHGAIILTNARIIQVSASVGMRSYSLKVDSFVVDNSLQRCSIDVPNPLPCTWRHGESRVHVATRLGEMLLTLPKTQWYRKCMIRMWQALSMVTTKPVSVQKSHLEYVPGLEPKEYNATMRWLHLALVVSNRLELQVLWPPRLRENEPYFDMYQLAPSVGQSSAFSSARINHQNSSRKVFVDLGSLSQSLASDRRGLAVTSWLRFPEEYKGPVTIHVKQAALLVCVFWVPKRDQPAPSDLSLNLASKTFTSHRFSTVRHSELHKNVWLAGELAGWKLLSGEWIPPSVGSSIESGVELESICYSLEVQKATIVTLPARPHPATMFGGQLLWDLTVAHDEEQYVFPRAVDEETLWSAHVTHERPDFFWMKVAIPALLQDWTITTHRLISIRVEPLTGMQQKVRRLALCFAAPPRQTIHFIPLSTVAGFVAEEVWSLEDTCINRCRRRFCGRNPNDQTCVSLKLLTRYGAKRNFPEGAALSQLVYLEPEYGADGDNSFSSALYAPVIKELRSWGTSVKLALDGHEGSVIQIVPTGDGTDEDGKDCVRGWQPRVSMAKGGSPRRRLRSVFAAARLATRMSNSSKPTHSSGGLTIAPEEPESSSLPKAHVDLLDQISKLQHRTSTPATRKSLKGIHDQLQQIHDQIVLEEGKRQRHSAPVHGYVSGAEDSFNLGARGSYYMQ